MFKLLLGTDAIARWPSFGLLIFFIFFVGVLIWVLRPGSKSLYCQMQMSVFDQEEGKRNER